LEAEVSQITRSRFGSGIRVKTTMDTTFGEDARQEVSMDKTRKTTKRRPRRSFTPEFKAEAVRLCRIGDLSVAQVAKDLDLTETALREWVQRADVDAGKGPAGALTSDERAELGRLRRENRQLQMEPDT
jgi:transposase